VSEGEIRNRFACSLCGALPGERCREDGDDLARLHAARVAAARAYVAWTSQPSSPSAAAEKARWRGSRWRERR
jgi:hypothetical protein